MENKPEQTLYDDSLLRPMSLANVSEFNNDPTANNSGNLSKMWHQYRSETDERQETASPSNGFEDLENDAISGNEGSENSTPTTKVI